MKRSSRWRRRLAAFAKLVVAVVAVAALAALVVRFAPPWLVSTRGLTGAARLNELSRVRVALLVLVIGALAAAVALYLFRSSVRERQEETRERVLTERFMRAVDQIGHPALDVRLGGIYSLERLARESPENHAPIIEILAAYVREHAPWPARGANGRRRPATDVQAAVTILGRRVVEHDTDAPLSLPYTALVGATLTGARFERALLSGANLEGADLFKAHLNAADLEGANLRNAGLLLASLNDTVLWGANIEGARLYGASLEGAALKGANLKGAGLTGANLKDAGLHSADLSGADLTGANLEGAGLEGANLEGTNMQGSNLRGAVLLNTLYDESTVWPNGLDPSALGAVRRAWPLRTPAPEPAPARGENTFSAAEAPSAWSGPVPSPTESPSPAPEAEHGSEPFSEGAPEAAPLAPPTTVGWPHEVQAAYGAPDPGHEEPVTGPEWAPSPAPGWPHEPTEPQESSAAPGEELPDPDATVQPDSAWGERGENGENGEHEPRSPGFE
jgi:uncharacterized protein YjbI with pentapeptide repeats/membrane protein implicated in regulation of membrane protease activity